uniref:Uncharacterized protein n=1 Tax=Lactuca sativa TaxID=4236 RepID=A0A9R1VPM5_LACSA|nr:hypothetical protein LSAT_V11C400197460 [Lactuca sativa]
MQKSNLETVPASTGNTKETSKAMDDPFVVLESASTPVTSPPSVFIDPLETIHKMNKFGSTNVGVSRGVFDFDDIDPLHGFGKPAPAFPNETNNKAKDQSPSKEGLRNKSSFRFPETQSEKALVEDFQDSQETVFDMPPVSKTSLRSVDQFASPPLYTKTSSQEHEQEQPSDDIWLTVSEIPPFIKPTKAPPPSRPPPSIPRHTLKSERGYSGKYSQIHNPFQASPLDELETFAMGGSGTQDNSVDHVNGEEMD